MRFWMSANGVCLLASYALLAILALGVAVYAWRFFMGDEKAVWLLLAFGFSLPFGLGLCAVFEGGRGSRDERE